MDEQVFEQREKELRTKCPAMFEHPDLRSDEILISEQIVHIAYLNIQAYRNVGLTSVRMGEMVLKPYKNTDRNIGYNPIFANLRQYIELAEKHKQEHTA